MFEMRIGLTTTVYDKQGGISRYVSEISQSMSYENEVCVLTACAKHRPAGIRFEHVPIIWKPISLRVLSFALGNVFQIRKMKKNGFDVVNSQGAEAVNSDIVTMQSVQKAAFRQFSRERGLAYRILKGFEPRNNIVLKIEKNNMKKAKKIIAIAEGVKQDIIRNYGVEDERIDVIHSGVNLDEFNPKNRDKYFEQIRRMHDISFDDTLLLFCGWEFKRKGLKYIIEALGSFNEQVKLIVVGGADKRRYIKDAKRQGVEKRVVFAGHQKNIERYFAASDIFVFPTKYEPFGLVITEAMASGIPAVTTRTAGAAELITDGKDGMLLDARVSTKNLVKKLGYILENDLAKKMGKNARKTAENYGWDSVAEKTLKTYEGVLKS